MGEPVCVLCGQGARLRTVLGGFPLRRCDRCDLEFIHPLPPAALLEEVYSRAYFQGPGAHGYDDYFGVERERAARKHAAWLARLASHGARGGRLLDVGCAAGYFLQAARDRGFEVRGVEPAEAARGALAPDLAARVVARLEDAREHAPYDLITAWDVLEHLPDPDATLRTLAPMLRPGGLFAAVVPVCTNLNARLLPRSWDQYKPPEHLWYFSPEALSRVLCRALDAREMDTWDAWRREGRLLLDRPTSALVKRLDRALLAPLRALHPRWFTDAVGVLVRRRAG